MVVNVQVVITCIRFELLFEHCERLHLFHTQLMKWQHDAEFCIQYMYFCGIFIYSGVCIGEARKWSLRSKVIKHAPLSESEITLFRTSFVSNKLAAGGPVSYGQVNLSSPKTKRTLYCSNLRGLWSHTKLA